MGGLYLARGVKANVSGAHTLQGGQGAGSKHVLPKASVWHTHIFVPQQAEGADDYSHVRVSFWLAF